MNFLTPLLRPEDEGLSQPIDPTAIECSRRGSPYVYVGVHVTNSIKPISLSLHASRKKEGVSYSLKLMQATCTSPLEEGWSFHVTKI